MCPRRTRRAPPLAGVLEAGANGVGDFALAETASFEHEPKIDPRYLTLKNAFLMPHLAAATIETQTAIGMRALDNIDAVLGGRTAPSLVTV